MTHQRFGWHISPHGTNEAQIREIVRRSGARTHTVLHSAGLANAVYEEAKAGGVDDPIIILRADWPDQNWAIAPFNDPDKFVRERKALVGSRLYLQYLNEPVVTNAAQLQDLLNRCIQFMDACEKYGVKGSVGGFADASMFQQNWLEAGLFDAFLRRAVEWTRAGHGVINHHDYSYGVPMKNGGGHSERDMLDPAKMQPANWPTRADMQTPAPGGFLAQAETDFDSEIAYQAALFLISPRGQRPAYDDARKLFEDTHKQSPAEFLATHFVAQHADHNWTAMRYMWPLLRARKLTGQGYWIVVGEYGPQDDMPHLRVAGISTEIERKFVGGRKLRGPLQQADLYIHWWPDVSRETAHIRVIRWTNDTAPEECLGITFFALNEDDEWRSFNYRLWPAFWPAYYALTDELRKNPVSTIPPVSKPANAGEGVLARLKTGYNLRNAPGTASVVLRAVAPNEIVTYYPNQPDKPQANGFTWVWVETDNGAGWMASQTQFTRLIPDGWPTDKEVALGVPFVSQLNTGESNNCGEAALTAVLNYAGNVTGKPTLKTLPVADVVATVGNNGGFASMGDLVNAAKHYGVTARAVAFQTLDSLRAELDAGRPVIALVERGKIPGATAVNAFTGAHFVTITGYDDRVMTILDPLKPATTDGMLRVYPAELLEAWRSTPGNSGNFQAVYFDASAFVPAEPQPEPEQPPLESVFLTLDEFKQDLTAKKQQRDALQMQLDAVNKQIAIMEAALARAQQSSAEQQQAA